MKIYRFTGDNIQGGQHNSDFIVLANSKEEAKGIIMEYIKKIRDKEYSEIKDCDWKLDDEVIEEELKVGIINKDDGGCC